MKKPYKDPEVPKQSSATPDLPQVGRHRSSKDRKAYCKGKKGIPHKPSWKFWKELASIFHKPGKEPLVYSCDTCGKHLDTWFANWWYKTPQDTRPIVGSTKCLKSNPRPK